MLKNSPEETLIRFIVRQMIGDKKKEIKDLLNLHPINWGRFKDLIIYHELTPFVYLALKDLNQFVPQDIMEFLRNNYYGALIRCQNLWQEFLRISMAFQQAGVTLLPIKGIALLYDIYKYMPLRLMTDIDLLVKEEDLQITEDIFCDLGYRKELYGLKEKYWREKQIHFTFYKTEGKNLPFVEVHWALDFKRKNRIILPKLWERIRKINVDGRMIMLLSPEDSLFSLALHSRRFGKILSLKYTLDIALLLKKYKDSFDWDYILKEAYRGKMRTAIFFILWQLKFLDINTPTALEKRLKIPFYKKRLIQQLIEKNTFFSLTPNLKSLYLKTHFLLYDNLWEPITYIFNIPEEQFAKYYNLNPYSRKTKRLYHTRFFYIPFRTIAGWFKKGKSYEEIKHKLSESEKNLLIIRAWGWSMYPNIRNGDIIILKKKNFKVGDVICFKDKSDKKVVHRVVKMDRGQVVTKGDNGLKVLTPVESKDILGVAIGIKRGRKVFPVKGKWLYGYFYSLSKFLILSRRIIKKVVVRLQDFKLYSKIAKYIFCNKNIEIEKPTKTENFYFIRAKVNDKEAGWIKVSREDFSTLELYVKVKYRGLGIEEKLLKQRRELEKYTASLYNYKRTEGGG